MTDTLDVSPPRILGVSTYPPGATFGPRRMQDYELVWVIEGSAVYRRADAEVSVPEGALVLCRPGATDFFAWDAHRRTRHAYFHFSVYSVPEDWPVPNDWPPVCLPDDQDILRPLFRHLLAQHETWTPQHARLTVAHLLTAYVSGHGAAGEVRRPAWPDAVERAWAFLHERLEAQPGEPLTLAEMASAACVTPAHLCRVFKQATGHSPGETVRLARLDRAAALLSRTNFSVSEVAALCGFASPYHFARRFKDAFGQTPDGARRAVQSGDTPPLSRLLLISG